jgi:hypothetical protein
MGLKQSDFVTTEFVLSQVDEAMIFSAYVGPFKLNRVMNSLLRPDRHPSCAFRIAKSGKLKYYDFARGEALDCFAFVASLKGITYREAVHDVACNFGLINCGEVKVFNKQLIKKAEIISDDVKKETKIEIVSDQWTESNLAFWKDFSISQDELEKNDVFAIRKLYINDKLIPNYREENRYAYIVEVQGVKYKKIYTPFAADKRFKWISNIPNHIPFGINKLTHTTNRLIIAKAQKDRLIWLKYFPDVIAPQSEKPYSINEKTRAFINKHYDDVIICMDSDKTGVETAEHFVSIGYRSVFTPAISKEKHGIKDVADFVKHYGLNTFEAYLKYLNLL